MPGILHILPATKPAWDVAYRWPGQAVRHPAMCLFSGSFQGAGVSLKWVSRGVAPGPDPSTNPGAARLTPCPVSPNVSSLLTQDCLGPISLTTHKSNRNHFSYKFIPHFAIHFDCHTCIYYWVNTMDKQSVAVTKIPGRPCMSTSPGAEQ